jgi:hypothetical protein
LILVIVYSSLERLKKTQSESAIRHIRLLHLSSPPNFFNHIIDFIVG